MNWISVESKLPPPDVLVMVCVKNKNMMEDGIWLYDFVEHDGDEWLRNGNTWEKILYWAFPTPPEGVK
jgi:hypothetical protein